jgi:hypothetical protein
MTYHDTSISPDTLTAPDDQDGIFVMQNAARHLRVDDGRLRCIDLIDNPHLETLDLSACVTPVHLTIRSCPKLATVLLPEAPEGAVLHWEFGEADSPVLVFGALASFDSCQPDGHTCQIKTDGAMYARSLLVPPGTTPPALADDTALFVLLGMSEDLTHPMPILTPSLRAVHLHGLPEEVDLDLNGPALTQAQIVNLPRLEHLKAGPEMSVLSVTRCQALRTITSSGSVLRIQRSGQDEMDLVGVWDHAHFVAVNARLKSGLIGSTQAHNCRHIFSDAASLTNATAPLAALPTPEAIHDPYWRTTLHRWVDTTMAPSAVLPALKILLALLETGDAPDQIWTKRRDLHKRHAKLGHLGAGSAALWKIPRDLAFETQEADFALWRASVERGAQDATYQEALEHLPWILPMSVLARGARRTGSEEERAACLAALTASLANLPKGMEISSKRQEPPSNTLVGVARLIEGLLPMRAHPAVVSIFASLPALLEKTLSPASRLSPLTALNQMGLTGAAASLLAQARDLLADNPDLAARFHAAALQPSRSDLLAGITKGNHPDENIRKP